ncbi:unnamed protein product [Chondrus crispus]|uniref:Uncharacterized protein n=1 Tax=Chondrus crispus TaxID=2769 RepID=R7QQX7_CHOCR|nr:unnamed protein product [Chondrus crispus]CDF39795.1 unnamed protein product [Chondrus crispus]|eukprot:XP_005710089.1 unnamed protein product [Chondrus crispus]
MDLAALCGYFCCGCGIACLLSVALYLTPIIYLTLIAKPQDFRKKYGAWAVVTGGSSGIGKAVTRKLASQGVNVCIVALDDDLLRITHTELQKEFPSVELRAVPVDLGSEPDAYMAKIATATEDVRVSILINNAGFLLMGFFDQRPMEQHIANIECNALAAMRLTHYFYNRMVNQNIKGCITFTSSAAFFMPAPFASMYGATKAMISQFAVSLALEANSQGIDITVFHPSYTHSNLYAKTPKLDVVTFLSKFGWTPEDVANVIFASAGRVVVRDMGVYAIATNMLSRYIDSGSLAKFIMPFVESMAPPGAIAERGKKEN